jgi:hypothetical protein
LSVSVAGYFQFANDFYPILTDNKPDENVQLASDVLADTKDFDLESFLFSDDEFRLEPYITDSSIPLNFLDECEAKFCNVSGHEVWCSRLWISFAPSFLLVFETKTKRILRVPIASNFE